MLSKCLISANSSRLKDVPTEPITVMQSKGNIELFPTTLIESNAMKRLVTLILSAALLCPMWAGAQVPNSSTTQTTVGALGQMFFNIGPGLSIPQTTVISSEYPLPFPITLIAQMYLTAYLPNNTGGSMALVGTVTGLAPGGSFIGGIPISGSANNSGRGYYALIINVGTTAFFCTLNSSTLNGDCYNYQGADSVVTYTGITQ